MAKRKRPRKSAKITEQLSPRRERQIVLLLCAIAAVRVLIFSAAFPFFNNVDEQQHVDLVMKYARGDWPRGLEHFASEPSGYFEVYGTLEYFLAPQQFETGRVPPPAWTYPVEKRDAVTRQSIALWTGRENHESGEPPLYYATAGAWLDLGRSLGIKGGWLLYWIRFLNVLIAGALVWVGFVAAKRVFPERQSVRLSVPLFLAIWPQSMFYTVQSDVLSPLCFGIAFVGLIKFLEVKSPSPWLCLWVGLALAATCLSKTVNIPLLAVGLVVVIFKMRQLFATRELRTALPPLAALTASVSLPVIPWFAWNLHTFGDLTATRAKIEYLRWAPKPIGDWLAHPIFTLPGLKEFWSDLIATFWRGEIFWFGKPIASTAVDTFYWLSSTLAILLTAIVLFRRHEKLAGLQRQSIWLALLSVALLVGFVAFSSISFDFGRCVYPSRQHPFFTSGRLLGAAAIPFFLFYSQAIWWLFDRIKLAWLRISLFGGIVLIVAISQILLNGPVFSSRYNFFHLSSP